MLARPNQADEAGSPGIVWLLSALWFPAFADIQNNPVSLAPGRTKMNEVIEECIGQNSVATESQRYGRRNGLPEKEP